MFFRLLAAVVVFSVSSVAVSHAGPLDEDGVVTRFVGQGEINWTRLVVRTSGSGKPESDISNPKIRRLSAERSAKIDALREALEVIRDIRVDAETRVEDYYVASGYVRSRIDVAMRSAAVVDRRYLSGGEVEVVVEVPMTGVLMEVAVPQESVPKVSSRGEDEYTGLIVDARGLDINPALAPRILDGEMRELYGPPFVRRDLLVRGGIALYVDDMDVAAARGRVGDRPLVVRGVRASGAGNTDIVISGSSASLFRGSAFLEEGRVIIVID